MLKAKQHCFKKLDDFSHKDFYIAKENKVCKHCELAISRIPALAAYFV